MSLSGFDRQRLNDLEEILEIENEKLLAFEKELAITASEPQKFELKQRIKREVIPGIRKHQSEYTEIISQDLETVVISEVEANSALSRVSRVVTTLQNSQPSYKSDDLTKLLTDIQEELSNPGKTASAKLKLTLPIIPLLASYDMELDTEALLVKVWQGVNAVFRKTSK